MDRISHISINKYFIAFFEGLHYRYTFIFINHHLNTTQHTSSYTNVNGCTYSKSISISRESPRVLYTLRVLRERLLLSSICRWTCANSDACASRNVCLCVCVYVEENECRIQKCRTFFFGSNQVFAKRARCLFMPAYSL